MKYMMIVWMVYIYSKDIAYPDSAKETFIVYWWMVVLFIFMKAESDSWTVL